MSRFYATSRARANALEVQPGLPYARTRCKMFTRVSRSHRFHKNPFGPIKRTVTMSAYEKVFANPGAAEFLMAAAAPSSIPKLHGLPEVRGPHIVI